MLLSVTYNKEYLTRYVLNLKIKDELFEGILDTACSTTLIPLNIAKKFGKSLNHKGNITVGGRTYKARLYLIENLQFGTFLIPKVTMFASDYKGILEDRILVGNNILYNLRIDLFRNPEGILDFKYQPYDLVEGKSNPFVFFFSSKMQQPLYPTDLLVDYEYF